MGVRLEAHAHLSFRSEKEQMKRVVLATALLVAPVSAQSNRTVLLMGAEDDVIVTSFAEENACVNLREAGLGEKGMPFEWAIAVIGHNGRDELKLIDVAHQRSTFLGTNLRKGVRNACYAIRGISKVQWERHQ